MKQSETVQTVTTHPNTHTDEVNGTAGTTTRKRNRRRRLPSW